MSSLFAGTLGLPLEETCVAMDLETTGLDPEREEIIEVAAVKFQGSQVIDTFQTLVNPYRPIPPFIQRLTGILDKEVRGAPPFASVAGELLAFLGNYSIVGHNVQFDLAFLARRGVHLANPRYDTLDMASLFLPQARNYSLASLTRAMSLEHQRPHRALDDAHAARAVFVTLLERALTLDSGVLAQIARLAARSQWPLRDLLERLATSDGRKASVGLLGMDLKEVASRLERPSKLIQNQEQHPLDVEHLVSLLQEGGPLEQRFPGYEPRPQQAQMLEGVAGALNNRHHLIVEGGTGIGKTVAYLLPAIHLALTNNTRVVLSTNTINLQEQLMYKDIPALLESLKEEPGLDLSRFRHGVLKGKANYLCLRRWVHLASGEALTTLEARGLARTLVWLQSTQTGDRGELNLTSRDLPLWDRISARGFAECPGAQEGACFYRCAREWAGAVHLLIVNHALLLSDLAMGGGPLPPYDYLIIDEAQHLEEEATRHFGFQVSQGKLDELAEQLNRFLTTLRIGLRTSTVIPAQQESLEQTARKGEVAIQRAREQWGHLCMRLLNFMAEHREQSADRYPQLRLTSASYAQPGWSEIEIMADNVDKLLRDSAGSIDALYGALSELDDTSITEYEALTLEMANWLQAQRELRERVKELVIHPEKGKVYWLLQEGREGAMTLNAAPLQVGPLLEERLFSQKASVVLTSATLATQGSFGHIRERVGFSEGEELQVDSPFDYPRAALVLAPQDMPEPDAGGYQEALHQAIAAMAKATQGRTLVLFTSHMALQATHRGLQDVMEAEEIRVLAQRIDGSPQKLLAEFQENPRMVLLGTASFWEGVDIRGDALKVLVLARLPFNVPTDPVFAARAELYEDSFHQYALPQAVLRFRQGFGRLIRSRSDRGVVVVMDRRILSKGYGAAFFNSIPRCTMKRGLLREVPSEIQRWLAG